MKPITQTAVLYGMQEYELDNLLVAQKNRIFWLIGNGFLAEAQASLDVVSPLWQQCRYAYKIREIAARLSAEVSRKAEGV